MFNKCIDLLGKSIRINVRRVKIIIIIINELDCVTITCLSTVKTFYVASVFVNLYLFVRVRRELSNDMYHIACIHMT